MGHCRRGAQHERRRCYESTNHESERLSAIEEDGYRSVVDERHAHHRLELAGLDTKTTGPQFSHDIFIERFRNLRLGCRCERRAAAVARAIQESFAEPFLINGQSISLAASIGAAIAPEDGDSIDRLLTSADLALYAAKNDRRGTTRFFEPAFDHAVRDRQQLEMDLRHALELSEFELHYQPILDLRTRTFTGFEALLRWRHPTRGLVPPGEFIPVAEEMGLIAPIGEWVIREAFAEAARWPLAYRIAVNVSSSQFRRGNLVGVIMNTLANTGLAHDRVEIEITESLFLENDEANLEVLRQLHTLGLKVAMDDFGTGYSALSYLLAFPFDKIKIDGSFVRALDNAAAAHAIVRSVAEIGNRLGMTVTAEGVETAEQLRNVNALGYSEAQGFLISRPMTREAVGRLLAADYDRMPEAPYDALAS